MRVGTFPAQDFQFGNPVAVAKPSNNEYPLFDSELIALSLNNDDLVNLQARVQALYESLRVAREQQTTASSQQLYAAAQAAYAAGTGRNPGSYSTFVAHGNIATGPYKTT